jgi:hypothetical protein
MGVATDRPRVGNTLALVVSAIALVTIAWGWSCGGSCGLERYRPPGLVGTVHTGLVGSLPTVVPTAIGAGGL